MRPVSPAQNPSSSPSSSTASSPDDETEPLSEPRLLGFVVANIVGLQHYSGKITGREMVALIRQPLNPFDPNAIAVSNTRSAQVGHVERSVAAVLSPLIDSKVAIVEGIVPKPMKSSRQYRLPCQLHVFARESAIELVRAAINSAGLDLIEEFNPAFGISEAAFVLEKKPSKSNDDSFLDRVFEKVEMGFNLKLKPVEPPKQIISSELFQHQKEGLGWMIERENSMELPPFWEEREGNFFNVLTNHETAERPEPLRGGILADDMGLGKTLILLSLIALDSVQESSSSSSKKRGRTGKKVVNTGGKRKITLVVCRPSVLTSWISQLEEHTMTGSLKVYLYHGERTKDLNELMKYDLVLTTYSTLSSEFEWSDSPMKDMEFFRIILDEAHEVKNYAGRQTKAVIALKGERRWAVTGTPIQNSSFDLFSLMAFLRFQPFSVRSYWQRLVQWPLSQGSENGLARLQVLMGAISLRRSKDLVGLPQKTTETCFVSLSAEEREQYELLEEKSRATVRNLMEEGTLEHNFSTVLLILLRLRQLCDDVALCPPETLSLCQSDALQDISGNPDLLRKLLSLVQDGDDFECPICISPPKKTTITCCAHIFCEACISRIMKQPNSRCPICRHPISRSDVYLSPQSPSEGNIQSSSKPSSKIQALLQLLQEDKQNHPSAKSVIFSQFRQFLLLIEKPLEAAGFRVLKLDGSMSLKKRIQVIKDFGGERKSKETRPTVLLASLKASGAGINLTAATRVYLIEPWWNPAAEEQAIDRVHRIGQREEVRIVRFIVRGSIEERIMEMQEGKRKLAQGAFKRKDQDGQKQMMVDYVKTMMKL